MKILPKLKIFLLLALIFLVCSGEKKGNDRPVKVEVREIDGTYRLFRGEQPYYIQGAGGGLDKMSELAKHGGNSLRTWSTRNAQ
ncbi:MAG: hypothetical protein EH225_09895, partial [Calditrichaeota bacterium]